MRSSHVVLDQVEAVFDDEQAVAGAGLLLPATLAERLGIKQATDQLVGLADRLVRPGSDASCSPWSPPWSRVPTASMTSRATVALSDQPIRLPSLCPSNTADDVLDRVFRAVLAGLYRRSLHFRRGSPTPFSSMQQCPPSGSATAPSTASPPTTASSSAEPTSPWSKASPTTSTATHPSARCWTPSPDAAASP
jgi:hypothetical protein